ncbi:MAG: hypothetical protein AB1452_15115 [Pseudomonadota bacterium]
MAGADERDVVIDWRLTTWDGARREQLRRWAELPLERMILALEEMEELSRRLSSPADASEPRIHPR